MERILFISLISFVLNFIWEISQAFLYAPHYFGIAGLIKVHLRASLGDVLLIFIILLLDAFIFTCILRREKVILERFSAIIFTGFFVGGDS